VGAGTGMRPSRPEHESDELEVTPVVTCFLRAGGDVLLLRRSGEVGSYRGRWGAVAGYAEGDPAAAARREIEEETGLGSAVEPVRRGEPFEVVDRDLGKRWIVHPYLFDCSTREVTLDRESVECAWVPPTEILRRDVVPELWTSWRRVAPDEETVAADREHGSAWISLRALEVLRDRAVLPSSAVTSTDRLGLDPTPSNTGPPPEGVVSADERGRQPALVGGVVSADEGGRQLALVGAAAPARLRGGVCNKVGTRPAALTAAAAGVPVWAVAASDKVAPRPLEPPGERADPGELYAGGAAGVEAEAPLFETTPGELIAAVITERGDLSSAEVDAVAREMAELEDSWAD